MGELAVWLDGVEVATLRERRGRLSLTYSDGVTPLGTPLVSMAMPVATRSYSDRVARSFFHGLLPEGEARSIIAYDLGVDVGDDVGLLRALGRDCAGALVVQTPDARPPLSVASTRGEPIDDIGIQERLQSLALHPLGVDARIRVSLAGVQPKLLLSRSDDTWRLPVEGAISTHILKPASRVLADTVPNEALCMRFAHEAGITAARTSVQRFGSLDVVVSERFDRVTDPAGRVRRVHQEDACQALSILTLPQVRKYQAGGGPRLRAVASLLQQWGEPHATDELIRHAVLHAVVGDADWHGKNVTFVHGADSVVRLAPLYDVMSTVFYSDSAQLPTVDTELGMHIGTCTDVRSVRVQDVVEEATTWGVARTRAGRVVADVVERLPIALDAALDATPGVPGELATLLADRTKTAAADVAALPGGGA